MSPSDHVAEVKLTDPPEFLHHHWEACVGSGHAALALRADWQGQLGRCRRDLGFARVRFHNILGDDLFTHTVQAGKKLDSFLNTDRIWDAVLGLGMSPVVEFSFMPTALASGKTTVFSYGGNVTPPADYDAWGALLSRIVTHWHHRYGQQELERWRFEIWNEPNLPSFWSGTREEYFKLYGCSAHAIKAVDGRLQVGGPVTAKNAWLDEFVAHCALHRLPLDFVSTHHYPTDAFGNASDDIDEQLARSPRDALRVQAQAARTAAGGLPLWYTEWNMTSSPHDKLHDLPIAAAYAVHAIMGVRGLVDGYSYWTFSDIFSENYLPSMPFHGGFGLLTLHGIPKPAYRAFALLHRLGDELWPVATGHPTIEAWVVRRDDTLVLLVVNLVLPGQAPTPGILDVAITGAGAPAACHLERIDDDHANPRRRWSDMGCPDSLLDRQVADLEAAAAMVPEVHPVTYADGVIRLSVAMPVNGVAAVTMVCAPVAAAARSDYGCSVLHAEEPRALDRLQEASFSFFRFHTDHDSGLVPDTSHHASWISVAAVGFSLACAPVAVERGWMARTEVVRRAVTALRFLGRAAQGHHPDASGYRGFFYHFLDRRSGRRTHDSELSTIDTALLMGGALLAAAYFTGAHPAERELRDLASALYRRVEWPWALAGGTHLRMGWHPVDGFLPACWTGFSEALLLYVLAAGSPTHPLDPVHYQTLIDSYRWMKVGGIDYLHAGPLFIHQYAHCFLDLRGIRDGFMREHDSDYFENSRQAVAVQQQYARENPQGFAGYGEHCWGISASDGPGAKKIVVDGVEREFLAYSARGVFGDPDDGTIVPSVVLAALPFAPDAVMRTVDHLCGLKLPPGPRHGFIPAFNLTWPRPGGWVCPQHYAINEGPAVLLVENHRSGLLWTLMRQQADLRQGLRRCGFTGGYLEE